MVLTKLQILTILFPASVSLLMINDSPNIPFLTYLLKQTTNDCTKIFVRSEDSGDLDQILKLVANNYRIPFLHITTDVLPEISWIECADIFVYHLNFDFVVNIFKLVRNLFQIGYPVHSYIVAPNNTDSTKILFTSVIAKSFPNTLLVVGNDKKSFYRSNIFTIRRNKHYGGTKKYIETIAKWLNGRWVSTYKNHFWLETVNLQGTGVNIATLPYVPCSIKKTDDFGNIFFDGTDMKLLYLIAEKLNFKCKFIEPEDGSWGTALPNGTYTGLVGHTQKDITDISLSCIVMLPGRALATTLSHPYQFDYVLFASPIPRPLPKWKSLVSVFSAEIWLMVLIALLLVMILYELIASLNPIISRNAIKGIGVLNASFNIIRFHTGQSIPYSIFKFTDNSRIITGVYFFYLFFIINAYKGSMLSFLTVLPLGPKIDKYEQVVKSDVPVGYHHYGGATFGLYSKSSNPYLKEISLKLQRWKNDLAALEKVVNGELIYINYKSGLDVVIAQHFTSALGEPEVVFTTLSERIMVYFAAVLVKRSFLQPATDSIILRAQSVGIFQKWQRDIMSDLIGPGEVAENDAVSKLAIEDLQGTFFLYFIGIIAASLACVIEKLTKGNPQDNSTNLPGKKFRQRKQTIDEIDISNMNH